MWRFLLIVCRAIRPFTIIAQQAPVFKADTFHISGCIRHCHPPTATFRLLKVLYNTPYGQQDQVIAQLDSSGHYPPVEQLKMKNELALLYGMFGITTTL
jgi:hypothetical protein